MYKVFKEGIAININISAGIIVQKISVSWDSSKNWLKFLITIDFTIIVRVNDRIDKIKIIVWSWKNIRCSIVGEFLSWENILAHMGIYFVIMIVWLKVCSWGGFKLFHSTDRFNEFTAKIGLFDESVLQII